MKPSSAEHCQSSSFADVELQADTGQHQNLESTAVRMFLRDSQKMAAAQENIEDVVLSRSQDIRMRAIVGCAQTILDGECSLFMVRSSGPQAGKIVQRLSVVE